MRNDLYLAWHDGEIWGEPHFKLREFESGAGYCLIDSSVITSLERVRADLCVACGCDVQIVITSALRTVAENEALAARLGWIEDGGACAHDSMHLPIHGGIAVDVFARVRVFDGYQVISQLQLGNVCRLHFDYVKSDYADGHVHADNRNNRGGK